MYIKQCSNKYVNVGFIFGLVGNRVRICVCKVRGYGPKKHNWDHCWTLFELD